jgi:importin-4
VLAEVITGMEGGITPFTQSIMQVLLKRLGDEDARTKSNAADAVGRLVDSSPYLKALRLGYASPYTKLRTTLLFVNH